MIVVVMIIETEFVEIFCIFCYSGANERDTTFPVNVLINHYTKVLNVVVLYCYGGY